MSILPDTVKKYGDVSIGRDSIVGEYSIIGYPYVESEDSFKNIAKTFVGNECVIGSYVIIYEGTKIDDATYIEDYCRIGQEVKIGSNCKILYGSHIYGETHIGDNCIIAGFCCERAKLGDNVRFFGELIHPHREPQLRWDDVIEDSPEVSDNVFIGFGAKIIGGITIGTNSYIAAGAIVTKNVPDAHIVTGINKMVHHSKWRGKLKTSHFFLRSR